MLLYRDKVNWNFHTEPVESTGGRRVSLPRGKVLGGSSSINGMLYVRGNAADFDGWAQMGCRGWSIRTSCLTSKSQVYKQGGDSAYQGRDGPLAVEDYRTVLPLTHRFVEAAQQAGFPYTPDYNGVQQEGVGYSQMTRRGRFRGSTAQTYLRAVRGNPKLQVLTDAQAGTLIFDGWKCVGVTYRQAGQMKECRAAKEVILACGA